MVRRGFGVGVGSRMELELYSKRRTEHRDNYRQEFPDCAYLCPRYILLAGRHGGLPGRTFVKSNRLQRRRRGTLRIQEDDCSLRPNRR